MVKRNLRIVADEVGWQRRVDRIGPTAQNGLDDRRNVDRVVERLAHQLILLRPWPERVEREEQDANTARARESRVAAPCELELILCRDVGDQVGLARPQRRDAGGRLRDRVTDHAIYRG